MTHRNAPFEVEQVEQLALINPLATHHDSPPSLKVSGRRNHDSPIFTRTFSTASVNPGSCRLGPYVSFHRQRTYRHNAYRHLVPITFSTTHITPKTICPAIGTRGAIYDASSRLRGVPIVPRATHRHSPIKSYAWREGDCSPAGKRSRDHIASANPPAYIPRYWHNPRTRIDASCDGPLGVSERTTRSNL
jgi:hypothetical protein